LKIQTKRIYAAAETEDGQRILIDRLWPRGISKDKADVSHWAKLIAPSDELRKWYDHDHEKWEEFRLRYFAELDSNADEVQEFVSMLASDTVTFVYSSRETEFNNAVALKEYVEKHLK